MPRITKAQREALLNKGPAMKMPRIIAGCVMLSVLCAAPGAHARLWEALHCGKYDIAMIPGKYHIPRENGGGCDPTYPGNLCDSKAHYYDYKTQSHRLDRWVVLDKQGYETFTGRRCRSFSEEEYGK